MARPKIDDARDRLLSAGLSLFARRGTERVNTNAIARRARLGVGTFYAHFESKHALLRELELRTLAGLRGARQIALESAGEEPARQVAASIEAAARFALRHPEAYRVTFGRERAGATAHGPVVTESSRPTREGLRRLQLAGRIDPELDLDLAARAYHAMEVGTLLGWIEDSERTPRVRLVETLTRLHPAVSQAPR